MFDVFGAFDRAEGVDVLAGFVLVRYSLNFTAWDPIFRKIAVSLTFSLTSPRFL